MADKATPAAAARPAAPLIRLAVGADYDRVAALRAEPSAENVVCEVLPSVSEAFRALRGRPDVGATEMSLSFYMTLHLQGRQPFVAIPVFTSRAFRMRQLYVRRDSPLRSIDALVGARVGLPEYGMTMAVWIRGIVSDLYGISPQDVRWYAMRDPVLTPIPKTVAAAGIDVTSVARGDLWRSLEDGSIDVAIGFPPREEHARLRCLLSNHDDIDDLYLRQTGIFPIMHTVVVRRSLCEEDPTAPSRLFAALVSAKRAAMRSLEEVATYAVTLPHLPSAVSRAKALLGENWWPYGLEANRECLSTLARYSLEQGLLPTSVRVDELFEPTTLDLTDSV